MLLQQKQLLRILQQLIPYLPQQPLIAGQAMKYVAAATASMTKKPCNKAL